MFLSHTNRVCFQHQDYTSSIKYNCACSIFRLLDKFDAIVVIHFLKSAETSWKLS